MSLPLALLVVAFMSLSSGLGPLETTDCAEALRQLGEQGAKVTHVRSLDLLLAIADLSRLPPTPEVAIAYTLQDRRDEVAILVCLPEKPQDPPPAPDQ